MPPAPGPPAPRGRGAAIDPPSRFEPLHVEPDPDAVDPDAPPRPTRFFREATRRVLTHNASADVGFAVSLNPYRGCEHGCAYCYARPTHEYFGLSAGLDFETTIFVKTDAPQRLRQALQSLRWRPQPIALSGVTDPYQPVERRLRLTRACLEVCAEFRQPVVVVTKNALVLRDLDLLAELARHGAAAVFLSVTTLREGLRRRLEPRTTTAARRLEAMRALAAAGVLVGVMVAPVIPGLTDEEMGSILAAAAAAGARWAGMVPLRLPGAVAPVFVDWLRRNEPDRAHRVLARVRAMRGGRLNDPRFGHRMRGQGVYADTLYALFRTLCRRHHLNAAPLPVSAAAFRRPNPPPPQLDLFGTGGAT